MKDLDLFIFIVIQELNLVFKGDFMSKLYFRYGAMNCGKTTNLLQVAHNYEEKGLKIIVIKSSIDKKGDNKIVSRLGVSRSVNILIDPSGKIKPFIDVDNVNCILVDEAQFLTEIQVNELWMIAKIYNIPVICYGLRTTFRGKLFEGSKRLMELADVLEEMVTICSCGHKAKFNVRKINGKIVTDGEDVAIDGFSNVTYESMCGKCYIEKVLKIDSL